MTKKIIFIKAVEEKTNRNRQSLWRYWQAGKFPKPRKIEGQNCWYEQEINDWIDQKMSAA